MNENEKKARIKIINIFNSVIILNIVFQDFCFCFCFFKVLDLNLEYYIYVK